MMKLTVLYDAVHTPLARKMLGLQRFEYGKPSTLDGSPSPYYLMAALWFDDMVAFGSAMGSPEGQETAADVGNFATGGATMLVTEIA